MIYLFIIVRFKPILLNTILQVNVLERGGYRDPNMQPIENAI